MKNLFNFLSICCSFLVCQLFAAPSGSSAQDAPVNKDEEQELIDQWMEVYDEIAKSFQVNCSLPRPESSMLENKKLLSVLDPTMNDRHGRVYLWTDQGRPAVIGSVLSAVDQQRPTHRWIQYEFHSLSPHAVAVANEIEEFWNCDRPGISWVKETSTASPSTNAARRLTQMRAIASQYSARSVITQTPVQLRLLPQPIYRYSVEDDGIADGAIFSFSSTTDPILYLLVEARAGSWFVALARSRNKKITVEKSGKEILVFDSDVSKSRSQSGPYYYFYFAESRLDQDPRAIQTTAWGQ